ncbi:GNAT family N-acetyltransferase [Cohnella xylanilytica]|uniref:GNAT family N-acetyltransferase n=1 Tax=Cohnella xylanilytica TaxID=557555 RepID=A0A841TSE5_9BACL|nr:GNAT family N-acetyltransferase [Cohnella xylanilytica]MBB6691095.1 GNAT family N-acetyltransferase [Cohnella xylanilytica]
MDIVIREFAAGDEDAYGKIDDSFVVDSILVPSLKGREFGFAVESVPSYTKSYKDEVNSDAENEDEDCSESVGGPDRIRYLAWAGDEAAGRIALTRNWNKYALIEDIAVDRKFRGLGIGRKLIDRAKRWAKDGGMPGLMLETQNNNVNACRFYQSCGFVLGGVDRYLYRGIPRNKDEVALFWYLLFE